MSTDLWFVPRTGTHTPGTEYPPSTQSVSRTVWTTLDGGSGWTWPRTLLKGSLLRETHVVTTTFSSLRGLFVPFHEVCLTDPTPDPSQSIATAQTRFLETVGTVSFLHPGTSPSRSSRGASHTDPRTITFGGQEVGDNMTQCQRPHFGSSDATVRGPLRR